MRIDQPFSAGGTQDGSYEHNQKCSIDHDQSKLHDTMEELVKSYKTAMWSIDDSPCYVAWESSSQDATYTSYPDR